MGKSKELKQDIDMEVENKLPAIMTQKVFDFLSNQVKRVQDGLEDGYKVAAFLKQFEDVIKTAKELVKSQVLKELKDGTVSFEGFEIAQTGGGKYDYSKNKEWNKLKAQIKDIEDDMKIAYKSEKELLDPKTGEIIEAAIYNHNKSSYKITKKRN